MREIPEKEVNPQSIVDDLQPVGQRFMSWLFLSDMRMLLKH